MDVRKLIDAVASGVPPAQALGEEEPSTFQKISSFIFGRGELSKLAGGSAGTPSSTSTGSTGGGNAFSPSPGMGGKSLADLAQDQANRTLGKPSALGAGKTSTIVHKSASSTSAPPVKSSAPPAVRPVSAAPKKPLTQSLEFVDDFDLNEKVSLFHPGQHVKVTQVDRYGYWGRENHPPTDGTIDGHVGRVVGYLDGEGKFGSGHGVTGGDGMNGPRYQGVRVQMKTGDHKGKTFDMIGHELEHHNVESVDEMEHGLTRSSRAIARVKDEPTMFSKEGAKHGAKAVVSTLKKAVSPSYRNRSAMMGRFGLSPAESRVSLLVQAVAEGADPRDVLSVAPRIMEGK